MPWKVRRRSRNAAAPRTWRGHPARLSGVLGAPTRVATDEALTTLVAKVTDGVLSLAPALLQAAFDPVAPALTLNRLIADNLSQDFLHFSAGLLDRSCGPIRIHSASPALSGPPCQCL